MAGLDDPTVLLRGGARDGETTTVDPGVRRILAPSEAPGMLDVYEETGDEQHVPGNEEPAVVFEFVGQEPAGDLAPELQHAPVHDDAASTGVEVDQAEYDAETR